MIFCITNSFLVFWESSWKKLSICYKWYNNIKTQVHFPLHFWFYCFANFHFGMASYYVQKYCQQNCMRKGCVVWLVKETVQMVKLNFVLTCVFFELVHGISIKAPAVQFLLKCTAILKPAHYWQLLTNMLSIDFLFILLSRSF